jgi:uncharacterized protein (DUF2235 family)
MGKNIVIFSDGTGNRGGLLVDERRSNVYKLYRATRCGPDSYVDALQQVALYDAGLGTLPAGFDSIWSVLRFVYNKASQATGLGLTRNIINCYAEIIRLYRPDDRIYLFGFSRGAYTVRCLGGVLRWCGVPTRAPSGERYGFDQKSAKRVAREGVTKVYQHASSRREDANAKPEDKATPRQSVWLKQRRELAARFRQKYESAANDDPNVVPYFIGIFDTVASLANPVVSILFVVALAIALTVLAWLISLFGVSFPYAALFLLGAGALVGLVAFLRTHVKAAVGFGGWRFWYLEGYPIWQLVHFTELRMKFTDRAVNTNVEYVRHAVSIDERRASFRREPVDDPIEWPQRRRVHGDWLIQLWFAGDHDDVGGSNPESESRLSDIALAWIAAEAEKTGLILDRRLLQLYPAADGMQHDQFKSTLFKYFGQRVRDPHRESPLHLTVIRRFEEPSVLHYDIWRPYRPRCLRHNIYVSHFWDADDLEERYGEHAHTEALDRVAASRSNLTLATTLRTGRE